MLPASVEGGVALVGNAQSLFTRRYGAEIDRHDVVARINRAAVLVTQPFESVTHGSRTDAWFMWRYNEYETLKFQRPNWMMQMIHWETPNGDVNIYSEHRFNELQNELGAVPSTGLMVLDFFDVCTKYPHIDVYGFDWKATPTFTDPKRETDKMLLNGGHLHDFGLEREYCKSRFYNSPRFNFRF